MAYINKEEALYKWDLTTYPQLDSLKVNIEPYQKLFALIYKWQKMEKKYVQLECIIYGEPNDGACMYSVYLCFRSNNLLV